MSIKKESKIYSESELVDIVLHRQAGLTFGEITDKINSKYKTEYSEDAIRGAHRRYGNLYESNDKTFHIDQLKSIARTKKSNSKTAKENRVILEKLNEEEDLLERIQDLVKNLKLPKLNINKPKVDKSKPNMTKELMVCDIHVGRKNDNFDYEILKHRLAESIQEMKEDIARDSRHYNIDRIIIALLGDMIESFSMHGLESARGCEFDNPEQVEKCIKVLFELVFIPVAALGIKIDVPAVTGNHDRTEHNRSMYLPGKTNWTWVIYNTLEMLCKQAGFKHVTFHIPEKSYVVLDIYGNNCLYEHFDNAKASTKNALEDLLNDRQTQERLIITFMRGGHYHEYAQFGRGRIIIGESLAGPDSYSDVKGYDTKAGIVLNSYIQTSSRPNCFYKSYPLYLK